MLYKKVCNARRINKIIWIIRICNRDHYFRVTHFTTNVHILLFYRLFYLQTYIIHNQLKLIKNSHNNDIVSPHKCHTFSQQSTFYILKEYMVNDYSDRRYYSRILHLNFHQRFRVSQFWNESYFDNIKYSTLRKYLRCYWFSTALFSANYYVAHTFCNFLTNRRIFQIVNIHRGKFIHSNQYLHI